MQVIQVYVPTNTAGNEEVEQFYDITKAKRGEKAKFIIVMENFNVKIGSKAMTDPANRSIWHQK